jgi:hypothetical protein
MSDIVKWDEVNGADNPAQRMEAFLDSTTDSYAILQLRRSEETVYERFASMRELERMGQEPDIDHYEVVYVGALTLTGTQTDTLEGIFTQFNVNRPEDFRGHSLSVSDIVALKVDGVVSSHYVDSIGFQELPDFIRRENYLKNAEMVLEDDYGMIDGIINNGSKQEMGDDRPSVLEQLKQLSAVDRAASTPKTRPERDER